MDGGARHQHRSAARQPPLELTMPIPVRPLAPLRPLGLGPPPGTGGPLVPYRAPIAPRPPAAPRPGPAPRPPGAGPRPASGNPLADALGAGAEILGRFLWGLLNGRGPAPDAGPVLAFSKRRTTGAGMRFDYNRITEAYTIYECSPAGAVVRTEPERVQFRSQHYPLASRVSWEGVGPESSERVCGFSGGPASYDVYPTRWFGPTFTDPVSRWRDGGNEPIPNGAGGGERYVTTIRFEPVAVYDDPGDRDYNIPEAPSGDREPLPVPPPPVPILGGPPAVPDVPRPVLPDPPGAPAGDPLPGPGGQPGGGPGGAPSGGGGERVVPLVVPVPVQLPLPILIPAPPVGVPVSPVPAPATDPVIEAPVTRPGDRVIAGEPIPAPVRDVVPTIEGIAVEVGRLEQKLEVLLDRSIDLGPLEVMLAEVLDELQEAPGSIGVDAIGLNSECRRDENGELLPPLQYAFGRSESRLVTVLNQLDAVGAALQGVVDLPVHICRRPPPEGQRVTVDFYVGQ